MDSKASASVGWFARRFYHPGERRPFAYSRCTGRLASDAPRSCSRHRLTGNRGRSHRPSCRTGRMDRSKADHRTNRPSTSRRNRNRTDRHNETAHPTKPAGWEDRGMAYNGLSYKRRTTGRIPHRSRSRRHPNRMCQSMDRTTRHMADKRAQRSGTHWRKARSPRGL